MKNCSIMNKLVIAVDFDGTICEDTLFYSPGDFPPLKPGAAEALQLLHDLGHTIIIHTCRGESDLIAQYLEEHGVPFDSINRNVVELPEFFNSGKPIAHAYIDDRAIKFDTWDETLRVLSEEFPNAIPPHKMRDLQKSCPLCRLYTFRELYGPIYYEDHVCIVVDCKSCSVPMVVLKRHTVTPTPQELQHMLHILRKVDNGKVDLVRRTIKDHWHAHLR